MKWIFYISITFCGLLCVTSADESFTSNDSIINAPVRRVIKTEGQYLNTKFVYKYSESDPIQLNLSIRLGEATNCFFMVSVTAYYKKEPSRFGRVWTLHHAYQASQSIELNGCNIKVTKNALPDTYAQLVRDLYGLLAERSRPVFGGLPSDLKAYEPKAKEKIRAIQGAIQKASKRILSDIGEERADAEKNELVALASAFYLNKSSTAHLFLKRLSKIIVWHLNKTDRSEDYVRKKLINNFAYLSWNLEDHYLRKAGPHRQYGYLMTSIKEETVRRHSRYDNTFEHIICITKKGTKNDFDYEECRGIQNTFKADKRIGFKAPVFYNAELTMPKRLNLLRQKYPFFWVSLKKSMLDDLVRTYK